MTPITITSQNIASVAFGLCKARARGGAPVTMHPEHAELLTDRVQDALREAMLKRRRKPSAEPKAAIVRPPPKKSTYRIGVMPEGDAAAALIERMVSEGRTQQAMCRELHWGRERLFEFCDARGIEIPRLSVKVTPELRTEVIMLRKAKVKIRDVAARVGLNASTINKIMRDAR